MSMAVNAVWAAVAISSVATAAAGVVSYVGQQQAADAAEDAGRMQKEAADAAARNAEAQSRESINRERINNRRRLARMRAKAGTSGLVMTGSALDVFAETAGVLELGVQDANRAGNMEAGNMRDQGAMSLWEARSTAAAQRLSSYGTLLSTAGSAAKTWV